MPWDRNKPTAAKYRTPEHRAEVARLKRQMKHEGYLVCAQPVCIHDSRVIYPGMAYCAGHDDAGITYIGPVHTACNVKDAAVRANARSKGNMPRWNL